MHYAAPRSAAQGIPFAFPGRRMSFSKTSILLCLGALFVAASGCNRTPTVAPVVAPVAHPLVNQAPAPLTAEDVRVGREAMPVSEVSLMLRGGTSQATIIADVNRRHIPEKISPALELQLSKDGAGPNLIAALTDEKNILTRNQKDAFDKQMNDDATRRQRVAQAAQTAAVAGSIAEEKERQRLLALQKETYRIVEKKQKEQADHDKKQIREVDARFKAAELQNGSNPLILVR
jgi:hypothetical protein